MNRHRNRHRHRMGGICSRSAICKSTVCWLPEVNLCPDKDGADRSMTFQRYLRLEQLLTEPATDVQAQGLPACILFIDQFLIIPIILVILIILIIVCCYCCSLFCSFVRFSFSFCFGLVSFFCLLFYFRFPSSDPYYIKLVG